MKKRILAISGSARQNSTNQAILNFIADSFSDEIDLKIYENVNQLPLFNPDLDNENPPKIIKELRALIKASDAVIIATPEYIFSLPGSLKNLIDWNVSTTVFENKPVAIIVGAALGEKAFRSLDVVMSAITNSKIPRNLKLLIKGVRGKVQEDGVIKDKETAFKIHQLVVSLMELVASSARFTQK